MADLRKSGAAKYKRKFKMAKAHCSVGYTTRDGNKTKVRHLITLKFAYR